MKEKLQLELRDNFEELTSICFLFNQMVLEGNQPRVTIETDIDKNGNATSYVCIYMYRCKKQYASVGIMRALSEGNKKESFNEFNSLTNDGYLFFYTDESSKILYIEKHSEKYTLLKKEVEYVPINTFKDFLCLDFYLRKPFSQLPNFLNIANQLLCKNAGIYAGIKTQCNMTSRYLNINLMFENINRPSIFLNVGLLSTSFIGNNYLALSKINYITTKLPNMAPCYFSCFLPKNSQHGPIVQLHVGKMSNFMVWKEIEKQCKLLDSIFPQ